MELDVVPDKVVEGAVVNGAEMLLETTLLELEMVLVPDVEVTVASTVEIELEEELDVEVIVGSTVVVELSVDEVDVEREDEVEEEVVVVTTAGTAQTLIHSLSSQISGADPVSAAAQAASSAEVAGSSFPHQHSRENSIPK
jgi:hypothetical protein